MIGHNDHKFISAVFITFSGNCKKALTYYQTCFGGTLQFNTFEKELQGSTEGPVVTGCLTSDRIVIYGSDLVHDEGRKLGNYISIFLHCKDTQERKALMEQLKPDQSRLFDGHCDDLKLIEITDAFDLRWILGV